MPNCAMASCPNYTTKNKTSDVSFHKFPKDWKLQKEWLIKCRRGDSINIVHATICSKHFTPDDFIQDFRSRFLGVKERRCLKQDATPSLHLPKCITSSQIKEKQRHTLKHNSKHTTDSCTVPKIARDSRKDHREKNSVPSTKCRRVCPDPSASSTNAVRLEKGCPYNSIPKTCYVPGCFSGCNKECHAANKCEGKHLSLFSCPRNEALLSKWRESVPRANKNFTYKDRICELHFNIDDLEVVPMQLKMPDGSDLLMDQLKLKPGAVPSKFTDIPNLNTKEKEKNTEEIEQPQAKKAARSKCDSITTEPLAEDETDSLIQFSGLKMPSDWWSFASLPTYSVFSKWNESFLVEKRVVLLGNRGVKVFIYDHEVKNSVPSIKNIDELSALLKKIDKYIICSAARERINIECLGFIPPDETVSKLCIACKSQEMCRN